jgi:hypothetical protein
VIDPHGDLSQDVLQRIPTHRARTWSSSTPPTTTGRWA